MNNLPIYDIIQLKVNVCDTGTFLVNFDKESFTSEIRENLILKIKELKDDVEPTFETQTNKINKLIKILNEVEPLYCVFKSTGDVELTFDDFKSLEKTNFILVVLKRKVHAPKPVVTKEPIKEVKSPVLKAKSEEIEQNDISESVIIEPLEPILYTGSKITPHPIVKNNKKLLEENKDYLVYCNDINVGEATATIEFIGNYSETSQMEIYFEIVSVQPKAQKENRIRKDRFKEFKNKLSKISFSFKKPVLNFPKFSFDYLFLSLFCMLFSFGVLTGIYEILNKQSTAAFLLVLAFIFLAVGYYSAYSIIYKRYKEKYQGLKYFLLIYTLLGSAIGLALGYIISKFALTQEAEELNFNLLITISIPVSLVVPSLSIFFSKLINLIIKKIKKIA